MLDVFRIKLHNLWILNILNVQGKPQYLDPQKHLEEKFEF